MGSFYCSQHELVFVFEPAKARIATSPSMEGIATFGSIPVLKPFQSKRARELSKVDCRFAEQRKTPRNPSFSGTPELILIFGNREKARNAGGSLRVRE